MVQPVKNNLFGTQLVLCARDTSRIVFVGNTENRRVGKNRKEEQCHTCKYKQQENKGFGVNIRHSWIHRKSENKIQEKIL